MKEQPRPISAKRSSRAVITVRPPSMTRSAQATKDAARRRAGSPEHHQRADRGRARLRPNTQKTGTIRGYDLGGGPSIIFDPGNRRRRVEVTRRTERHVSSAAKDSTCGCVSYLADEFPKEKGINLRNDKTRAAAAEGSRRAGQGSSFRLPTRTRSTCRHHADATGPKHPNHNPPNHDLK